MKFVVDLRGIQDKDVATNTKLWIDDLRDPVDYVANSETWDWAKNFEEAMGFIAENEYNYISFDHDLGENLDGTVAKSGYDIAKEIETDAATNGKIKPFRWNVHSANPKGADNIRAALKSAERFWKESEIS